MFSCLSIYSSRLLICIAHKGRDSKFFTQEPQRQMNAQYIVGAQEIYLKYMNGSALKSAHMCTHIFAHTQYMYASA